MNADELKNMSWVEFFNAGWFSFLDNKDTALFEVEWNRRISAMADDDEYENLRFDVLLASQGKTRDDLNRELFEDSDASTN